MWTIGAAEALRRQTGAMVYAGTRDAEILTGRGRDVAGGPPAPEDAPPPPLQVNHRVSNGEQLPIQAWTSGPGHLVIRPATPRIFWQGRVACPFSGTRWKAAALGSP